MPFDSILSYFQDVVNKERETNVLEIHFVRMFLSSPLTRETQLQMVEAFKTYLERIKNDQTNQLHL